MTARKAHLLTIGAMAAMIGYGVLIYSWPLFFVITLLGAGIVTIYMAIYTCIRGDY